MKKYQNVLTSWNISRYQEGNRKETGYETHKKQELFLLEKIWHSEISKLREQQCLKDWNLPLNQMLGMEMLHHVYYSEAFLNWPHCLQSFHCKTNDLLGPGNLPEEQEIPSWTLLVPPGRYLVNNFHIRGLEYL